MTLPLGRFVQARPAAVAPTGLVLGRFVAASFKVRYVRTPAGARRYGVPIGSPIPIGRSVKPKAGGESGSNGSSADAGERRRVDVPPAQRPAARRHFWGGDNGATWDDDANQLQVDDPARAAAVLDETLANPDLDADQRDQTQQLRDRIAATDTAESDQRGPHSGTNYRPARNSTVEDWANDDEIERLTDAYIDADDYTGGDVTLGAVWERQGFDGKPTVLPPDEFDALPPDHVRIYRGMADLDPADPGQAARFAEQFRSGDKPYAGFGIYGNGTYTATDRATAEDYMAGSGALIEMALRPDARVVDHADLPRLSAEFYGDLQDANPAVANAVYDNPGVIASMLGYDAIRVRNPARSTSEDYYVVLNRTAVYVREEVSP